VGPAPPCQVAGAQGRPTRNPRVDRGVFRGFGQTQIPTFSESRSHLTRTFRIGSLKNKNFGDFADLPIL
jgi:hypothetical protein